MRGLWLSLVLAITPALGLATAHAQTPAVAAQAMQTTTAAWNASATAEKRVVALAAVRTTLQATYDTQLRGVDRLKQQRASWRRDRELRDALATANETAGKLADATRDLAAAQTQLATARRQVVAAIDAELALHPAAARTQQLAAAKAKVAPPTVQARRIVLPDTAIDPLADPEELDQQAAALRESEAELQRQVAGLEAQEKQLEHVAELRSAHDRTIEMDQRDDNAPRRTGNATGRSGETAAPQAASDANTTDAPGPTSPTDPSGGGSLSGGGTFESNARVELADVVDATTIDTLARAQRSGDPAQRAAAAKAARDAVAARLDQLKKKRLEIEARAKSLRK